MLKSLDEAGRQNWVFRIRNLLFQYGFGYVWIAQELGNEMFFKNQFSARITDCMKQTGHSDIMSHHVVTHIKNLNHC